MYSCASQYIQAHTDNYMMLTILDKHAHTMCYSRS